MMTLATAHALLPAARLVGDPATRIERVHTDTRTLRRGDLFVALKGERFDGHDHLGDARDVGASALLAERGVQASGLPGLEVADSLAALQQLARGWRAGLMLPLVAVTGSNGKTTVTQMVAAIFRAWVGEAALATAGNLNNHIGVPLTLLRLRGSTRAAVVELGTNHPGEIAELAAIAAPTVALVNNAQREHQEFLHGVEAAARENGAVIGALPAGGTAVFPAADAFAPLWRSMSGTRRVMAFGLEGDAGPQAEARPEVRAAAEWRGDAWVLATHTPAGAVELRVRMAGRHNALNALAATACAVAAGAPLAAIARGLAAFEPVAGRSALSTLAWRGRTLTLVDDSYNANPDSVLAAIEVLAALPAPRWLVLGDMGEVGANGPAFHAEVGARAAERGIEHLWFAGAACAQAAEAARAAGAAGVRHLADADAAVAALGDAPEAASVLVKGSRFMRMERVVRALREEADRAA